MSVTLTVPQTGCEPNCTIASPDNQVSMTSSSSQAGGSTVTFDVVASGSELPASTVIVLNGSPIVLLDIPAKYLGQSFTYTTAGGSVFEAVFVDSSAGPDGPAYFESGIGVVNNCSNPNRQCGYVYLVASSTTTASPESTTTVPPTTVPPTTVPPTTVPPTTEAPIMSNPNNNGGTIKAGGSIASPLFSSADKVYDDEREVVGSVVVDGDNVDKSISAGPLASMESGKWIIKKVTTVIAGQSNLVLRSGAAQPSLVKSINKLETLRTRRATSAVRDNKFNSFTGEWDDGYPVVAVDALATDNAATPSRGVPGSLVFKIGSQVPVVADYKAKTN
jgi:hypothetical protein